MNLSIGKQIRELRRMENLTQQELANLTNLSASAIKSYENSLREPNSKAMVALENYFNVSGAYLRGETDDKCTEYIWDDPEMMKSIKKGTPTVLKTILDIFQNLPDKEQKNINNILIELRHILTSTVSDETQKSVNIDLIKEVIWMTNNFIDACVFSRLNESDAPERMINVRKQCVEQYAELLLHAQTHIIGHS